MTLRNQLLKRAGGVTDPFFAQIKAGENAVRPAPPCPPLRWLVPDAIGRAIDKAAGPPDGSLPVSPETPTMKPDIHPNYHMIKVVMTNGVEFTTRSTWGEDGATMHLDIDPNTHPAWTGGSQQLLDRGGRLSRFNTRFGGLGLGGKK